MKITCEFQGGLQVLFEDQNKISIEIDENQTIAQLVDYLAKNKVSRTPELFIIEAGILVLINDTDWELEEGYDYKIKEGDTISFISTLHGG